MSPVQPTDPEKPMEWNAGTTEPAGPPTNPADPVTTPEAHGTAVGTPTTPAPTKVDAYKPRGIRGSEYTPLAITDVVLRLLTAIFTLIAFAVIASNSRTVSFEDINGFVETVTIHFNDLFFFSYLLTANVIAFAYILGTLVMSCILLFSGRACKNVYLLSGLFALDQIFSYLLMSASTSAATGVRDVKSTGLSDGVPDSFFSQSYAAIAFSFLAFFALAAVTIISIHRLFRVIRAL